MLPFEEWAGNQDLTISMGADAVDVRQYFFSY